MLPTGEPESFEAFMRARGAGLIRYAYVLTGSQHDAADLAQEALVRVGTVWERVRGKGVSTDVAPGDPASTNHLHCGLTVCVGEWSTLGPSGGSDAVVQNLDGSGYLALGSGSVAPLGAGRFMAVGHWRTDPADPRRAPMRTAIWDRATGRAGMLPDPPGTGIEDPNFIFGRAASNRPFATWGDSSGLVVFDPRASQ